MAAHQAPLSLGFSRQEYWSGLPFPSPMHESEKWKGSRSVVSDAQRPHGLQPSRLLHPWDFPGKSTGVGCHCLLWVISLVIFNLRIDLFEWSIYCEFAKVNWDIYFCLSTVSIFLSWTCRCLWIFFFNIFSQYFFMKKCYIYGGISTVNIVLYLLYGILYFIYPIYPSMNLTFAPSFVYFEIITNSQEVERKYTGGLECL